MRSIDKYVYPNTNVLINKWDCHDADTFRKIEEASTATNLIYLQMHPIHGNFDFAHLKDIHRFIFQDIFDWAGEIRSIDIGKGNLFCRAQFIEEYAKEVFGDFYSSCEKNKHDRDAYLHEFVRHYADMNALHPFREGNGRSQREFARELCLACGYVFDLTSTSYKQMIRASVASFDHGDNSGFEEIFEDCIIPVDEYADLKERLSSVNLIFSKDDRN